MPMADNSSMTGMFGSLRRYLPAVFLLVIIVFVTSIRLRLLQVPLERDEGEYAYIGQLLLGGFPPYLLAYSLKLPGMFFAYAFFMQVFGQSIEGIRLGLLLVNLVTILLLFLIARDLSGDAAGIAASASYAVLSLSPSVLGIFSHATHFVMVFVLLGLLIFLKTFRGDRPPVHYLFCGLFIGIGFTMKQHAVFFVVFPVVYLFIAGGMKKVPYKTIFLRSLHYFLGTAIPYTAICLYLTMAGVFGKFWFWTFDYAREYVSEIPVAIGLKYLVSQTLNVMRPSFFLWLLAAVGLFSLFTRKISWEDRIFLLGFLMVSVLAICPGYFFREHYYIMLLPAICLFIGESVRAMHAVFEKLKSGSLSLVLSSLVIIAAMAHALYHDREYFFLDPVEIVGRKLSGGNPFPESLAVAKYIEENTSPNDRILVLGSEPQIYFYSRRISATGHIYMYGLMENQKYARSMQQEMIREIVSANPEIIVVVTAMTSWLIRPDSDTTILDWTNHYAAENFDLVGIADKISRDHTVFLWNRDAAQYAPQSGSVIYLFKKRRSA
jgi:4-amino-4-deoxy-L-arabinose transferase-like glycosyltransferase